MKSLVVVETGPLATLQDLGRPGYAHLGVPRSGGADRGSLTLANRLVGNPESAAVIEATLGRLKIRARGELLIAVTGAHATVRINGAAVGLSAVVRLPDDAELTVDVPTWGLRNYVAVRGGIDVDPILGSRSTDTLSGVGPAPLDAGRELPIGRESGRWPAATSAPINSTPESVVVLEVTEGPRRAHVLDADDLLRGLWEVSPDSNRVGVRLDRPDDASEALVVHRDDVDELASEGMPHGAIQIPPSGRPVLFLADHPVTGGYPVVAVLTPESLDRAGQLVAGSRVRLRPR
ncbi:biotin-dependent carboxyltransferase family protein [Gordonia sp. CPCC 205515]|uniref:5-oxoprolinase subunit C family protein n=1 Tax=Gordonia sp. CPCC 205515 TaxID=3140791 RepID=UPI003AF373AB